MAVRKLVERTYIDSDWTGESTDTKPTENVGLNNLFLELDTGDFYYCAKQGSVEEEELYNASAPGIGLLAVDVDALGDSIIVEIDGTKYVCEKHEREVTGVFPYTVVEYGAPLTDNGYDYTDIPFNIHYDVEEGERSSVRISSSYEDGIDSFIITSYVVTSAEWKKVGEGSSPTPTPTPGIEGNLNDGLTIHPSAWEVDENIASVIVPYYELFGGDRYTLYEGDSSWTETASAIEPGRVFVGYWDGDLIIESKDNTTTVRVAIDEVDITNDITLRIEHAKA